MKIVDRKTFLDMPPGTVFSEYIPCCFGEWSVKGDTIIHDWPHDFWSRGLIDLDSEGSDDFAEKLHRSQFKGESLELDHESEGRDGCYEGKQLYAVLEKKDLGGLIDSLTKIYGTDR